MAKRSYKMSRDRNSEPPEITTDHLSVGLAAVFEIAQKWRLNDPDLRALLGEPSQPVYESWRLGNPVSVSLDTQTRISLILRIYKTLRILYADDLIGDTWIHQPNDEFGGRSGKDLICSNGIEGLLTVCNYLDVVRHGG